MPFVNEVLCEDPPLLVLTNFHLQGGLFQTGCILKSGNDFLQMVEHEFYMKVSEVNENLTLHKATHLMGLHLKSSLYTS